MSSNNTNNKNPVHHKTDILIIGGGLSGLYLAWCLSNKPSFHKSSITILESNDRLGGRIHTVSSNTQHINTIDTNNTTTINTMNKIYYEAGAARFSKEWHKRVWSLIHKLKLNKNIVEISGDVKPIGINSNKLINVHDVINSLDVSKYTVTSKKTLLDIIKEQKGSQIAKQVERQYPYFAELGRLAWHDAYRLFTNDFMPNSQYYALLGRSGGLSSIINALSMECKAKGVKIHLGTRVISREGNKVETMDDQLWIVNKHIIYACPVDAINNFDTHLGKLLLNKVEPVSLYRIYAGGYPTHWFRNMPKMSVAKPDKTPLKFVIPISDPTDNNVDAIKSYKSTPLSRRGVVKNINNTVIMISYTDSKYADAMYDALDAGTNNTKLHKMVQSVFGNNIPRPSWVKHYYWKSGMALWRPGTNSQLDMQQLIGPHSSSNNVTNMENSNKQRNSNKQQNSTKQNKINIWVIGENVSHYQGWMEGALQTAEYVLNKLDKSKSSKSVSSNTKRRIVVHRGGAKTKKSVQKISKSELAKHKHKHDGWLAINGKVYNVTSWISKHPGGDIIMKGLGKDATKLFKNIRGGEGHPAYVMNKILGRYYVGDLI